MRDCPNAEMRDQLPEYVHGRLDARARAIVESHLSACADCAAEHELVRSLSAAVAAALAAQAPAVNTDRIVAALPSPRRARLSWFRTAQWRAAAVVVFMAGSSSLLWVNARAPASKGEPAAVQSMTFAGGVTDLTDAQLNTLLGEMEQLSSLPSAELPVSTLVPAGGERAK